VRVVSVTIGIAVLQLVILLLLARLLGPGEYSVYSVYFSVATSLAALLAEWIRLVVARFSGVRGDRLRGAILHSALTLVLILAAACLAIAGGAAVLAASLGIRSLVAPVAAVGVLTASNMIGDMLHTVIRFNRGVRPYAVYAGLRVGASGVLAVLAGAAYATADAAVLGFAVGGSLVVASAFGRFWSPRARPVPYRRLVRFVKVGWAMAISSISSLVALSLARILMQSAAPPRTADAMLLAFDLSQRGLTVLGAGLTTWLSKALYKAAHARGAVGLAPTSALTSTVFGITWNSFAIYGSACALAIPIALHGRGVYGGHEWAAALNVLAGVILSGRIYNLEPILFSVHRYGWTLRASLLGLAIMVAFWIVAVLRLPVATEFLGLPVAVIASLAAIAPLARAVPSVRSGLANLAMAALLGMAIFALLLRGASAFHPALLAVSLPVLAVNAAWLVRLSLRYRRDAREVGALLAS